ncbi:MAG: aspartate aminotransferase family protein [Thalassobaculum sp.]|uniref:aminotransferase family protein n=1 Tax=Thalassobaculum sp. TaxID=2022740 RepID=UPI0032EE4AE7
MAELLRNSLDHHLAEPTPALGTLERGEPVQVFALPPGSPARPRIERAEGIYMWDSTGRRYVDAGSGPVACNIGYGNRRVIEVLHRQAEAATFAHPGTFESAANRLFAERLSAAAGPGYERVFVVSGGSEANEAAIKLARQMAVARGEASRWKVVSRQPSYHGSTLGALSVSGDPAAHDMFGPLMQRMPKVPAPVTYRIPPGFDQESWAGHCADVLERTILEEGPDTVLAFMQEPVGGLATGALVPHATYMRRVREICDRHGVLLIHDEVMSGGGRTGAFLSHEHWPDCRPDIVVLAKGAGAGYFPLGVVLAPRDRVAEVAAGGGFMHGHTALGNPLACAVGLAVLDETLDRGLVANAAAQGARLRARLDDLVERSPIVGDVRGKGLLMALELVADKAAKTPFSAAAMADGTLARVAMEQGMILYQRRTNAGRDGDWVMVAPPLIATAAEIDMIADGIAAAVAETERRLGVA